MITSSIVRGEMDIQRLKEKVMMKTECSASPSREVKNKAPSEAECGNQKIISYELVKEVGFPKGEAWKEGILPGFSLCDSVDICFCIHRDNTLAAIRWFSKFEI